MEIDAETLRKRKFRETLLIVITLIIITAIAILFLKNHAKKEGRELMLPMDEVSQLHLNDGIVNCEKMNSEQSKRLVILNNTIQKYKEQHEITFLKLYEYHFTSSTLFLVFSILSALALFLITQEGWKNTAHGIRVLFLVCSAFASFFGLSISTFEQKISIDQNANAYIDYDNLQKELVNYCATSLTLQGDSISFDKLHSEIMNRAKSLHGFYLEFDTENVNAVKNLRFNTDTQTKTTQESAEETE